MINKLKIPCGIIGMMIICALIIIYVKPEHTQSISALATVILTYMIWRIYSRQAAIMEGQKQLLAEQIMISKEQTGIARNQAEIQGLLANLEYAPLVLPVLKHSSAIWQWPESNARIKNVGNGSALEIKMAILRLTASPNGNLKIEQARWSPEKEFLMNGEEVGSKQEVGSFTPHQSHSHVLVIHCKDIQGRTWHTTVNIDSKTSEYTKKPTLFVWKPSLWQENQKVQKFCVFCQK